MKRIVLSVGLLLFSCADVSTTDLRSISQAQIGGSSQEEIIDNSCIALFNVGDGAGEVNCPEEKYPLGDPTRPVTPVGDLPKETTVLQKGTTTNTPTSVTNALATTTDTLATDMVDAIDVIDDVIPVAPIKPIYEFPVGEDIDRGYCFEATNAHAQDIAALNNLAVDQVYGGLVGASFKSHDGGPVDCASLGLVQNTRGVGLFSQNPASWNLDRIDQSILPLNNTFNYNYTGSPVIVYLLDTGIFRQHSEFMTPWGFSRVLGNVNFISDAGNGGDCPVEMVDGLLPPVGHGTGLASLVGGNTHGVAKNAWMFSVHTTRCNDLTDTLSARLAGMNFVKNNHPWWIPGVVLMASLVTTESNALDRATRQVMDRWIPVVTAAGGSVFGPQFQDSCNYSPQRLAPTTPLINVGAFDNQDTQSDFSDFGPCITLFAPGGRADNFSNPNIVPLAGLGNIPSPFQPPFEFDPQGASFGLGTSVSSAITAGVVAQFIHMRISTGWGRPTPSQVKTHLRNAATNNTLNLIINPANNTVNKALRLSF